DAENAFSETIEKTVSRSRSKSAKKEKEQVSQAELPLLSKNSPLKSKPVSPYAASYEKHRGDEFFSLTQKAKDEFSKPEIPVTKVPVVQPEFFTAANPVESRKSFRTKVMELKKKGLDDEEIAAALKRSIQEVKFSLELS
ncbi:MAG: hypothetical protein J5780_00425, partial [Treponema sp.]|nr:hypothetical protein [Treponema sp.]